MAWWKIGLDTIPLASVRTTFSWLCTLPRASRGVFATGVEFDVVIFADTFPVVAASCTSRLALTVILLLSVAVLIDENSVSSSTLEAFFETLAGVVVKIVLLLRLSFVIATIEADIDIFVNDVLTFTGCLDDK